MKAAISGALLHSRLYTIVICSRYRHVMSPSLAPPTAPCPFCLPCLPVPASQALDLALAACSQMDLDLRTFIREGALDDGEDMT